MFKIQKNENMRIFDVDDSDCKFDLMRNVKELFWVHLNLDSSEKNYILYKSSDDVYTLMKFKYEIRMENDIPVGKISMLRVYISGKYSDIIKKCLIHKEYEMYMNETH